MIFECCNRVIHVLQKESSNVGIVAIGDFNLLKLLLSNVTEVIFELFPFSCFMVDFATLQYYCLRCCSA